MALARSTQRNLRQAESIASPIILEAARTFQGSYLKVNGPTHATAAHQGRIEVLDTDNGSIPFGVADRSGTDGNTATDSNLNALDGDESEKIRQTANLGAHVREAEAVTGASAQTDVGTLVYLTDDDALSITRPTKGLADGMITRFHSSTSFDCYMFSVETKIAIALGGCGQETLFLGYFDWPDVANGDILTTLPLHCHGRILRLDAYVDIAFTGAGGTALLNAEIGTTDLTGGVVTLSTAAGGTKGAQLAGTAITAANVFHEGDTLSLEIASAGGTRTTGRFNVFAQVERLPGV